VRVLGGGRDAFWECARAGRRAGRSRVELRARAAPAPAAWNSAARADGPHAAASPASSLQAKKRLIRTLSSGQIADEEEDQRPAASGELGVAGPKGGEEIAQCAGRASVAERHWLVHWAARWSVRTLWAPVGRLLLLLLACRNNKQQADGEISKS